MEVNIRRKMMTYVEEARNGTAINGAFEEN
jgi:hypothetical protein